MQASLPQDLVPIGATTLLFGISTSCAVFLSIGQAVFADRLSINLSQVVPADVVNKVASVGATSVRSVVSARDLPAVLQAYSNAVTQVFVCILNLLSKLTFQADYSRSTSPLWHRPSHSSCCWVAHGLQSRSQKEKSRRKSRKVRMFENSFRTLPIAIHRVPQRRRFNLDAFGLIHCDTTEI